MDEGLIVRGQVQELESQIRLQDIESRGDRKGDDFLRGENLLFDQGLVFIA